jgi:hypothetical protein
MAFSGLVIVYLSPNFSALKNSVDGSIEDMGPWASVHLWTLSRHLWEAPSSFDFFHIYREKPHYTISNVFFDDFLKEGKGDDVDDFGRILLVVYVLSRFVHALPELLIIYRFMGMDETRQWFQKTGSTF